MNFSQQEMSNPSLPQKESGESTQVESMLDTLQSVRQTMKFEKVSEMLDRQDLAMVEAFIEETEGALKSHQNSRQQLETDLNLAEEKLRSLQKVNCETLIDEGIQSGKLHIFEEKIEPIMNDIEELTQKISKLKQMTEKAQNEHQNLQQIYLQKAEDAIEKELEYFKADTYIQRIQKEINAIEKVMDNTCASINQRIQEAETAKQNRAKKLGELKAKVSAKESEFAEVVQQSALLKVQIADKEAKLNTLTKLMDDYHDDKYSRKRLEDLESELGNMVDLYKTRMYDQFKEETKFMIYQIKKEYFQSKSSLI